MSTFGFGILEVACAPPGLLPASTPVGSQWDNLTNWDRLAAFGIIAALFSVIYWILISPDEEGETNEKDN
jgi:type II secretory pathway component PulM